MRKNAKVIIIGAGAAGLAAAKVLSDAGHSAMILEARDRIGGRILTHRDAKFSVPLEMGAEFIHGHPDATWKLVHDARLLAVDLPFNHSQRRRGRLVALDDMNEELSAVMNGLVHVGPHDISFADYLRQHRAGSREARQFALNFVEGFDAADPERISALSLAEEQEGIGDVDEETQSRLVDGYGALVQFLRRSLNPTCVSIKLRTPITQIDWDRDRVEIHAAKSRVFRAKRVIVTLPLGVLQLPPERPGAIRFSPEIFKHRDAAMQLASGPIVKVIVRFASAFWEDPRIAKQARADEKLKDAAFLHAPDAPFPTWWTQLPLRLPLLTGWAGGPSAVALAGRSKRELRALTVDSLAQLFDMRRATLASRIESFHSYDWASDPFSRGAYSYVTVGGMRARAQLAKPLKDTLFFAGEATDTSGQASTVAGALISGQRAADEVLKTLK